jgi:exosortase
MGAPMQSDSKPETTTAPAKARGFMEELRAFGDAIPHKALFGLLLLGWVALFHFYGNPTLGYINTRSLFGWLKNSYDQSTDDNFGMFILPVVLALLWWKRAELAAVPKRFWWPPLLLFAFGALLHLVGYTVQQTRLSVVGFFFGLYAIMGMLWGWAMLRALFFPYLLFAFAVPLTGELEGLTLPLRYIATKIAVIVSHIGGIDVVQKGTLIESGGGHFSYNVEAACSGLRSLTTMLMLGCIFGFTAFQSNWKRAALIASAVPLAICGNVLRLISIVIAASWKYDEMIAAKQPLALARAAAQELGSVVHDHSVIKLAAYVPAFVGMMLLARWLREDDDTRTRDVGVSGRVVLRPAWAVGAVVLAITLGTAGFLATQHTRQKLGQPGVRVEQQPMYSIDMGASTNEPRRIAESRVHLPARVLDFQSQEFPIQHLTWEALPKDTVFGHRVYGQTNGLTLDVQVVLMGADRSSIHKPQYCLNGSGFDILKTEPKSIRVDRPRPHDLPVMKLTLGRQVKDGETIRREAGVFVYWFVADGEVTAEHRQRMWWMARDMLKTGVLQRWAYVICFAPCAPGDEETTYERMKEFIAAAVPEFHTRAPGDLARAVAP